ncbi:MAG: hypothetical protein ACRDIX_09205 [Actinomycetota bacterium]
MTIADRFLAERVPRGLRGGGEAGAAWRTVARGAAVLFLSGSAVIHFSQVEVHLEEWRPAGMTFLALAGAEVVLVVATLIAASRATYLAGIWVSQATILLWILSRTVGIPFGPEAFEPESVGRPDLMATILEGLTIVALLPLFLDRPMGTGRVRASASTYLAIAAVALLTVSSTWVAVLPAGGCDTHDGSEPLTGPLVPIDGHSILSRGTPAAEADLGEEVGLVVGLLRDCGSSSITIRSARLIRPTNFQEAVILLSYWVVPPDLAVPGRVIPVGELERRGSPLPGTVALSTEEAAGRDPGLVLLAQAARPGEFLVSAVEITYTAGGRSYVSPYATVARLEVG